eukprot:CAMPEP_0118910908 /NCGR_PEP_ID=MMETSP1166-20130328/12841_1 /TAXON_ID=1104430 /ORGANISM="Chrysoreinhardia sp, Strain CCMP3193" /LENGTH=786 /DNA_ID=CAMNT_0006850383 /DNA_START=49 /DNA_END=2409 /DNA_ORIENTATION=-
MASFQRRQPEMKATTALGRAVLQVTNDFEVRVQREKVGLTRRIDDLEEERDTLADRVKSLRVELASEKAEKGKALAEVEKLNVLAAEAKNELKVERCRILGALMVIRDLDVAEAKVEDKLVGPDDDYEEDEEEEDDEDEEQHVAAIVKQQQQKKPRRRGGKKKKHKASLLVVAAEDEDAANAAAAPVAPVVVCEEKQEEEDDDDVPAVAAAKETPRQQSQEAFARSLARAVAKRSPGCSASELVEACSCGQLKTVEKVIKRTEGYDALYDALYDAAEAVLSVGLDRASRKGHARVCSVLLDHGARAERACVEPADLEEPLLCLKKSHNIKKIHAASSAAAVASKKKNKDPSSSSSSSSSLNKRAPAAAGAKDDDDTSNPQWSSLSEEPALHAAIAGGFDDVAKLLVSKGANANAVSLALGGSTPLHVAAAHNRSQLAHFLVAKCNARLDSVDDEGRTPADVATEHRWHGVSKVLKDPSVLFWARANRANRLCREGEMQAALDSFDLALAELAKMKTQGRGLNDANVMTLHNNRAKALMTLSRHCEARAALDTAFDDVKADPTTFVAAFVKKCECDAVLLEHAKAAAGYDKLVAAYDKRSKSLGDDDDADDDDAEDEDDDDTDDDDDAKGKSKSTKTKKKKEKKLKKPRVDREKVTDWRDCAARERAKLTVPPHELLGISKTFTGAELKKAYRSMSIRWHPDRHASATAEHKHRAHLQFQRISAAYETLLKRLPASVPLRQTPFTYGRWAANGNEEEDEDEDEDEEDEDDYDDDDDAAARDEFWRSR